jgi:hypothetical protein
MRRSRHNLIQCLKESGINPLNFKAFIEECVEMELAVLYANPNKIPDSIYNAKKTTMLEAKIFCQLLG